MNQLVGILKATTGLATATATESRALVQCRVSVIMVVYRTGPALMSSLQHVLDEALVDDFVIVDNGSPQDDEILLRSIAEREPKVQLIQGHGNVGFACGANMGAKAAKGRALVFLNPENDLLGSGYHITQSKIAIGSGARNANCLGTSSPTISEK